MQIAQCNYHQHWEIVVAFLKVNQPLCTCPFRHDYDGHDDHDHDYDDGDDGHHHDDKNNH